MTLYYYPVVIDLEYQLLARGAVKFGRGHTVRLSTTCVQFECADYLPEQSKVEISIVWPAQLDTRSERASGIIAQARTVLRASAANA